MLNDECRTVEENYTCATQSSNLRCEADRRTDVDVLIASGCTPGILGGALMRLHSEWDGAAKPRAAVPADFVRSALPPKSLAARAAEASSDEEKAKAKARAAQEWELTNAEAKVSADRANEQAMLLLMCRLKSLPRVLEAIEEWALLRGLDEPKRLAHAVVAHWLDSTCQPCGGRGHEMIAGTPSLGRRCKACHGTGKRKEPMGEAGRRALNMFDECVQVARTSMSKRLRQTRA